MTGDILPTLDTVYICAFTFRHSPHAWVCRQYKCSERTFALTRLVWTAHLCLCTESEGSQHKEQVDSLFLMASWMCLRTVQSILFVNEAQCHGEFTKKHLLRDEAVLDVTTAALQTTSKWFHNALPGNDRFFIMFSRHSHAIARGRWDCFLCN